MSKRVTECSLPVKEKPADCKDAGETVPVADPCTVSTVDPCTVESKDCDLLNGDPALRKKQQQQTAPPEEDEEDYCCFDH